MRTSAEIFISVSEAVLYYIVWVAYTEDRAFARRESLCEHTLAILWRRMSKV